MRSFYGILASTLLLVVTSVLAQESQDSSTQGFGASMGRGYGPDMMRGMTEEQRQQHWGQMRRGPGMGRGMGPRMGHGMGPGMGRGMTPEQRQQHWEQMRQQGYNPGMGRGRPID